MENIKDKMDKTLRELFNSDPYLGVNINRFLTQHPWFGELNTFAYFERL